MVGQPMNANDLYLEIGKRITNARLSLGWSQEEAASKLEVTRVTWNHMEKGNQKIAIDRLLAVAELLKIPPGRLVPGLLPDEVTERVQDENFSEEETDTIYKTLDKYQVE